MIRDEISKHCSAHYDDGQAAWSSPWRELPLYQAWRSAAQHDRSFEIQGVSGFRKFVAGLPHEPHAALVVLLNRMKVPQELWEDFLLCESLTMPGWSAWTKYLHREAERQSEVDTEVAGLLAMRVAYEVALSEQLAFQVEWSLVAMHHTSLVSESMQPSDEDLLRYALLKASEIAFRSRLLKGLASVSGVAEVARTSGGSTAASGPLASPATSDFVSADRTTHRSLSQMVFCIDVRSERIRTWKQHRMRSKRLASLVSLACRSNSSRSAKQKAVPGYLC